MKNIIGLLGLFLIFITKPIKAQENILTYDQFMLWVQENHPISKQSDLFLEFGEQELRKARGGFDPYLYGTLDEKQFKETEYYNKREAGLLVPTVAGIELEGVVEQSRGTYLNSEDNLPENGLYAVGAAVNIGNGLFIDKRRAALRQAKILNAASQEERKQGLNFLYYDAAVAYWKWSGAYADLKVNEESLRIAEIRFDAVKSSFEQGDLPAIDTVEAFTQVLDRTIKLQKSEYKLFSSAQELNVYLWDTDGNPIDLDPMVVPQEITNNFPGELDKEIFLQAILMHPELRLLDYDLDFLDIERRYKAEQLKPKVKLKYNFLTETFGGLEQAGFLDNNYKFGIQVSSPLLLRKERGSLGLTRTKIKDVNYKRDLKFEQLRAKFEKAYNEYQILGQQSNTFAQNITALESLLRGERIKFELGESSLFLINSREKGLFDALLVNNSLFVDINIAYARIRTAAGLGFEGL